MTQLNQSVIASIIAAELAEARAGGFPRAARLAWTTGTPIGRAGEGTVIDVDSLELVRVATEVSEFFCMHQAGIEDRLLVDRTLGGWIHLVDQAEPLGSTDLCFRTSGSTGTPKRITHSRASLLNEARFFAERFEQTRRVVCMVPTHHMYGFVHGGLVPQLLGVPVIDAEFAIRTSVIRGLRSGDHIVATPTMWRELAETGLRFPAGVSGVTSGAAIPGELVEDLLALGLESLDDVYGSTETGALGVRSAERTGFTPLCEQRVRAEAQDVIDWLDDGTFVVGRRNDACVQVAGVNVSTDHVRTVLLEHRAVGDCAVKLMGDDAAARLAAFVVPASDAPDEESLVDELSAYVSSRLPAPARPTSFTFGTEVPVSPLGKAMAWSEMR